jgi:hypothetical protein
LPGAGNGGDRVPDLRGVEAGYGIYKNLAISFAFLNGEFDRAVGRYSLNPMNLIQFRARPVKSRSLFNANGSKGHQAALGVYFLNDCFPS